MQGPPASFLKALEIMLRPLVRLLIGFGVTYPTLCDLLKHLYVRVAADEFQLDGRDQTVSRISVLTGVHRKDAKRLKDEPVARVTASPQVTLGSLIVSRWLADPASTDEAGDPLPLPRIAEPGTHSFATLVESVSRDVRPRAVLDELVRQGAVSIDGDDRVVLNAGAFVPALGFDEKAEYFGYGLADHIAASGNNLDPGRPAMLDRAVYYDGLTPASVQKLKALAERAAVQALLKVNREATRAHQEDRGRADADQRIAFGAFFYTTTQESAGQDGAGKEV